MSDTKSDSEDSVVFVGVTQLTAHVHQESEKRELTQTLKKTKRRRIFQKQGDPSLIPESEGEYTTYIYISYYLLDMKLST